MKCYAYVLEGYALQYYILTAFPKKGKKYEAFSFEERKSLSNDMRILIITKKNMLTSSVNQGQYTSLKNQK